VLCAWLTVAPSFLKAKVQGLLSVRVPVPLPCWNVALTGKE